MMYYSKWYSPSGDRASGGLVINAGFGYDFTKNFQLNLNVKNITNHTNLYPMNSNAGGVDVSPGTAGWENTTFWVTGILKL
jgi:outer membrane receptor protein involved in Fe transport